MRLYSIIGLISLSLLGSCSSEENDTLFKIRSQTGIEFSNTLTNSESLNILNYLYFYNGAGVAVMDVNNDGLPDIYLGGNQEADKLYLNKGGFQFEDITESAGITNTTGWTTGVTSADVNGDGLIDIYVSRASGHLELSGHNLLFLNQGVEDGNVRFKEASASVNLDYAGLATQAAFFDYDLDGDLDAYLMNHSVYPNQKYGKGTLRLKQDSIRGDRLMENKDGVFEDVSAKASIFQNEISFGLGLAISDINSDGYPDIYIGNDFFENDYLYINNTDGTFTEVNSEMSVLGHSTHFSMGNDISDLNNDGRPDIFSVDMLPEDLATLKSGGSEYNYPIFQNQLRSGYEPQFMQNTLHLNWGQNDFSEVAFQYQVAASEWSWAPLATDFDNDGHKDLYITNGIPGATNDLDFVNFIANENIQKRLSAGMEAADMEFIKELPEKKTVNYFFRNLGVGGFENSTQQWSPEEASFSNGAAYADLDNDGDMDIIVNRINEEVLVLENTLDQSDAPTPSYLKVQWKGTTGNTHGIGGKLEVFVDGSIQYFENYATRGYLSAVAPETHIGLGRASAIDSLRITWPSGVQETLYDVAVNQTIIVDEANAVKKDSLRQANEIVSLFKKVTSPVSFTYRDGLSIEFSRDPLIPYASTNLGPDIVSGDLNRDSLEDLVLLGAKGQLTELWMQQTDGSFVREIVPDSSPRSINEDTGALIFDANGDGNNDLLIISGGNEIRSGDALQPRLYLNTANGLVRDTDQFKGITVNGSVVTGVDFDNDGDMDVCIMANAVPQQFGATPQHYLFQNDGFGRFVDVTQTAAPDFAEIGTVYDLTWKDLDGDGYKDAVIAGHWMPVQILLNSGSELKRIENETLSSTLGWWNTVKVADFDKDGDLDIIAGNWGQNTRLQPTDEEPVRLYRNDFDENGKIDPILTYYHQGMETTLATKDELSKQLPYINKKFLSYKDFSEASIEEIFGSDKLGDAEVNEANELSSCYFENKGNLTFVKHKLPWKSQFSSVHAIEIDDFNNDGYEDALLVGNNYEISTQLGRLDASHGLLLLNDANGFFTAETLGSVGIDGACRSIEQLTINNTKHYVIGRNNDTPLFLIKEE